MEATAVIRFTLGVVLGWICCVPLLAEEPLSPPDKARAIVAQKFRDLRPNQLLYLGDAKVVGEFNDIAREFELDRTGPRGRDFTIKMVWAPDRKRALFCGANHAVPHRLNDVWEFDLATMTWQMLYAPDNPRDYTGLGKDPSDVEFRDGIFVTKRGGPGIIGHTWWGLTYDTKQRELLFMNTWVTDEKKAALAIGGKPDELFEGPPLWSFSPERRTWKMVKTAKPFPRPIFGGMLEYVSELNGTIWHANNWQMRGSWLLDAETAKWKNLTPADQEQEFEEHAAEPEQVGYYDPQRKQLIVQRHYSTHHYDVVKNRWKKVLSADPESGLAPYGHDAYSPMYYDPKSGHGLLLEYKTNKLWAYNPDQTQWTLLAPEGDDLPDGSKRLIYFDHAQNVLVITRDTSVWAYRYQ